MFIIFHDSWEPFRLRWTLSTSHSAGVVGDITSLHIFPHLAAAAAEETLTEKRVQYLPLNSPFPALAGVLLRHKSSHVGSRVVHQLSKGLCLQQQFSGKRSAKEQKAKSGFKPTRGREKKTPTPLPHYPAHRISRRPT